MISVGGGEVVVSGCSTESWEVAAMKDIRNGMKQWELRGGDVACVSRRN